MQLQTNSMSHLASHNSKYYTKRLRKKKKKKKKKKQDADSCMKLSAFGFTRANPTATESSSSPSAETLPSTSCESEKFTDSPSLHKTSKKQEDISDSKPESDEGQTQQASTNTEATQDQILIFLRLSHFFKKQGLNSIRENSGKQRKMSSIIHLLNMPIAC